MQPTFEFPEAGPELHEQIVSAFKARGSSFSKWCLANGHLYPHIWSITSGQKPTSPVHRHLIRSILMDAGLEHLITVRECARRGRTPNSAVMAPSAGGAE